MDVAVFFFLFVFLPRIDSPVLDNERQDRKVEMIIILSCLDILHFSHFLLHDRSRTSVKGGSKQMLQGSDLHSSFLLKV